MVSTPSSSSSTQPPWQVLVLVSNHLDPKTLAKASSVCKSWFISMSSDHLWKPICATHFPSLSTINSPGSAAVPFRRLYALGHSSATRRRQHPPKPRLSLHNLIFSVHIRDGASRVLTVVTPGAELRADPNGVFRFDMEVQGEGFAAVDPSEGLKLVWSVVLEGFRAVFTMMDCEGKGRTGGWFSEELPSPGCCCSGVGGSGLVADLTLRWREKGGGDGGGMTVGVGVLSVVSWRYVRIEDALRYLQHFLRPSDV
ncbi:hypothetical protein U1Q18_007695 [Sarracenia purpurea var. burkii]